MRLHIVLAGIFCIGLALSGCSSLNPPPEDQASLALACETTKCQCQAPHSRFSLTTAASEPVQWRSDGSAMCRKGYLLSRIQ